MKNRRCSHIYATNSKQRKNTTIGKVRKKGKGKINQLSNTVISFRLSHGTLETKTGIDVFTQFLK